MGSFVSKVLSFTPIGLISKLVSSQNETPPAPQLPDTKTLNDRAMLESEEEKKRNAARFANKSGTALTGSQGLLTAAPTSKKTLLGQ